MTARKARRFVLVRHEDVTGVSGTGVVAEGIEFSDGWVAMHWPSNYPSTSVHRDINDVRCVHGHDGRTLIRWIDPFELPDRTVLAAQRFG